MSGTAGWTELLPPDVRSVARARVSAQEVVGPIPWMADRLDDVRLVVSEVVTNAIRAQGAASTGHDIDLRWDVDEQMVRLVVRDHGGGFEPPTDPPWPGYEGEGGYGLPLISALADSVEYARLDDGTEVAVEWQRR